MVSFEVFVRPVVRALAGVPSPASAPRSSPRRRPDGARHGDGASSRGPCSRATVDGGGAGRGLPVVRPVGGQGSHLVADLASATCLAVVPRGRHRGPAGRRAALPAAGGDDVSEGPGRRPDARRRARAGADGRRLGQGGHRPRGHRAAGRVLCSPRVVDAAARGGRAEGRRARRRPVGGHPGREADAGPRPARPPRRRARRHGGSLGAPTTASTSRRPSAPPTAPVSRWRP